MAKKIKGNVKKMLAEFDEGFRKAMDAETAADANRPKNHDVSKGEFVQEVDPKDYDK